MATAVVTRKSGAIALKDQQAEPYFLPNTLAQDKIVTSNVLTGLKTEWQISAEPNVSKK